MLSPITIASVLLLGVSQIPSGVAHPVNASSFIIKHVASDYFPNSKGDLSPFDVHVQYIGYNATTQSWLSSLNPASATTLEDKAMRMTEAAYAKPFDANDPDMTADVNSLLATIAGNATALKKRDDPSFTVSGDHTVVWAACAPILSCFAGVTCSFNIQIGEAPRSRCESSQDGQSNCCISWSDYNTRQDFFSTTWTTCNNDVQAQGKSDASCQGHGGSSQGGDVCLSDRSTGCT